MVNSSVVGMSYAKLKVTTGVPLTSDNDNIESATILGQGDRVAIGVAEDPIRCIRPTRRSGASGKSKTAWS